MNVARSFSCVQARRIASVKLLPEACPTFLRLAISASLLMFRMPCMMSFRGSIVHDSRDLASPSELGETYFDNRENKDLGLQSKS